MSTTIPVEKSKTDKKKDLPIPFFKIVNGLVENVLKKKNQEAAKFISPPSPCTPVPTSASTSTTSTSSSTSIKNPDLLWNRLRQEAITVSENEPIMKPLLQNTILHPNVSSFEAAVAYTMTSRLFMSCSSNVMCPDMIRQVFLDAMLPQSQSESLTESSQQQEQQQESLEYGHDMSYAVRQDVLACCKRDAACETLLEAILYYKGLASLVCHRAARRKWKQVTKKSNNGSSSSSSSSSSVVAVGKPQRFVSLWLQSQASAAFGVDIHPASEIGAGVFLDHGTGIVIGETARVGDGCTLLHGVTLGGTGKDAGDRHPKVGNHVLIGAGASILGNIKIGDRSKIGAGSIVLKPIPHGATAVGAPAKIVGWAKERKPGSSLDMSLNSVLPVVDGSQSGGGPGGSQGEEESGGGNSSSSDDSLDNIMPNDTAALKFKAQSLVGRPLSPIDPSLSGSSTSSSDSSMGSSLKMNGNQASPSSNDEQGETSHNNKDEDTTKNSMKQGDIEDELLNLPTVTPDQAVYEDKDNSIDNSSIDHLLQSTHSQSIESQEYPTLINKCSLSNSNKCSILPGVCPFRNLNNKSIRKQKHACSGGGAISMEQISVLLDQEDAAPDEIGEVYFALLKKNPGLGYVPFQVFQDDFVTVAGKYTRISKERCVEIVDLFRKDDDDEMKMSGRLF